MVPFRAAFFCGGGEANDVCFVLVLFQQRSFGPQCRDIPLIEYSNNFQGYVSVFFLHLGVSLLGGEAVNKSYSMSGALSQCWNVAEKNVSTKSHVSHPFPYVWNDIGNPLASTFWNGWKWCKCDTDRDIFQQTILIVKKNTPFIPNWPNSFCLNRLHLISKFCFCHSAVELSI